MKYGHLYRHEIADGPAVSDHVNRFLEVYNTIRPHEALAFSTPLNAYQADPTA